LHNKAVVLFGIRPDFLKTITSARFKYQLPLLIHLKKQFQ